MHQTVFILPGMALLILRMPQLYATPCCFLHAVFLLVVSIKSLLQFQIIEVGGPPLLTVHSCLLRVRAFKEPQMCHLCALLQAVYSVLCSEDTLEEKQCCCAVGGLISGAAYGELDISRVKPRSSGKDLGKYKKWTCAL